jgi:hypothetical protein
VIKVSSAAQTYSIFYGKDKRISEIVDSKKEKLDLKVWQDSKDQNSRARFHHFFEKVAELEFPKKMIEAL